LATLEFPSIELALRVTPSASQLCTRSKK